MSTTFHVCIHIYKWAKSPGLGLGRLVEGNPAKIVLLETNTQNRIGTITDCRAFHRE